MSKFKIGDLVAAAMSDPIATLVNILLWATIVILGLYLLTVQVTSDDGPGPQCTINDLEN